MPVQSIKNLYDDVKHSIFDNGFCQKNITAQSKGQIQVFISHANVLLILSTEK